jgi:hypothetical protein
VIVCPKAFGVWLSALVIHLLHAFEMMDCQFCVKERVINEAWMADHIRLAVFQSVALLRIEGARVCNSVP